MGGTLVYKQSTISGSPAVADQVAAGNMNPVTSNAVNEILKDFLKGDLKFLDNISNFNTITDYDVIENKTQIWVRSTTFQASNRPAGDNFHFLITLKIATLTNYLVQISVSTSAKIHTRYIYGVNTSNPTFTDWQEK